MVLQVVGQALAAIQPLLQFGVRDVARHHHRAAQRQPRLHRIGRQLRADLRHRPVQVDRDRLAAEMVVGRLRQILRGIGFQLLQEHAVGRDLRQICRSALHDTPMPTGSDAPCRGSRITRTSWQKYLPPNCAPMPMWRDSSSTFCLHLQVAERVAGLAAGRRQRIEPAASMPASPSSASLR
jgi:hypothetical protein